ncbi:MAG: hypothetical protein HY787_22270 [Deltaproteobacteria bacterium]|nr:hypothetical protein [Deltaproteobacteria bacterium]
MTRLIDKKPEEMNPEELAQHTRIGKFRPLRRDKSYGGPYDPWIRSPELAKRMVSFGTFIR